MKKHATTVSVVLSYLLFLTNSILQASPPPHTHKQSSSCNLRANIQYP